jgi:hypothetical protein
LRSFQEATALAISFHFKNTASLRILEAVGTTRIRFNVRHVYAACYLIKKFLRQLGGVGGRRTAGGWRHCEYEKMFFSLIEFNNNFFFFSKNIKLKHNFIFVPKTKFNHNHNKTMPTSYISLMGEDLKLNANGGAVFGNLFKETQLKELDVLGLSVGDFDSGLTIAEGFDQEAKSSIALKLTAEDQDIVDKAKELDAYIIAYTYKHYNKVFPNRTRPATREEFEKLHPYTSPLKHSDKYGYNLKLALITKDGKRFKTTKVYRQAAEDTDGGVAVPVSVAELSNGVRIVAKMNLSVCWTFGLKWGSKWVMTEALLQENNNNNNKESADDEAGVFTGDAADNAVEDAPVAKKAKTSTSA